MEQMHKQLKNQLTEMDVFEKTLQILIDKQNGDGFEREIDRIKKDKRKSDNKIIGKLLNFYEGTKIKNQQ